MPIQYKEPRIQQEFMSLGENNPTLQRLLYLASEYAELEFGKPIVLTCIYRSPAENAALYSASVEPTWKPHTLWLAADLRSSIYTPQEINKMLSVLNNVTVFGGQRKAAAYHEIAGNVYHYHIQCSRKDINA